MREFVRRGAGLAAVLFTSGCIFSFQRPELRVADVRLASLGISGGIVAVQVEIVNPNGYDLESSDLRYNLAFSDDGDGEGNWVTLAEGDHDRPVRVAAGDTATVDLQVPFDLNAVSGALGRLLRRGQLDYRFTGELQVTEPRNARVPFDRRGVFRP